MFSSLLYTALHYIRLCLNFIASLFFNSAHKSRGGDGIGLSALLHRALSTKHKLLTFDNGMQVEMGKQIAEGGFSYVFEAFPANDHAVSRNRGGRMLMMSSSSPSSSSSSSQQRSSSTLASTNSTSAIHGTSPSKKKNGNNTRRNNDVGEGGGISSKYALKRINCSDREIVQSCRHEAGVHRTLPSRHPNLLELLGLKFEKNDDNSNNNKEEGIILRSSPPSASSLESSSAGSTIASSLDHRHQNNNEYDTCYMLFPYIPHSLRGEISKRNILLVDDNDNRPVNSHGSRRQPFATGEILRMFGGLVDALMAMHNANISHRDVKLENVLLQSRGYGDDGNRGGGGGVMTPVLMDFGSAGPLAAQLTSRQRVLTVVEDAASNTTMPYRPPELFEGGTRHGPREMMDYGKVDVWSLGCVLFGLMHGTSPFEMEFVRNHDNSNQHQQQYGLVRIVECTHLKILGEAPFPSWAGKGLDSSVGNNLNGNDVRNGKYPLSIYKFIRYMIHHDRNTRPDINEVAKRFGKIYLELLGKRWISYEESQHHDYDEKGQHYDDFDSLIASRDFV